MAPPGRSDPLTIDVQFNIPVVRFSRRRGGAFLRHITSGKVILAHRGIVALGHGRISKEVLFEKIDITLREAQTSSGTFEFLPIGELESPKLVLDSRDSYGSLCSRLRLRVRSVMVIRLV